MKYSAALLCILTILFLCNCQGDQTGDEGAPISVEDSTERLDTIFSQDDIDHLNQMRFSKYESSQNRPVDWSKFRMVTSSQDDSLMVTTFQPEKSFYEMYGRMLKYSPDRSMFIDIDSYNIEIQKNRKGQSLPIEKGPDSEVSLIDIGNNKKTRLVFLGPGNGIEDAGWIDNSNVLLIGYHETDTTKARKAVIWRYHIPTETFHLYESSDTTMGRRLLDFRIERLKNLF